MTQRPASGDERRRLEAAYRERDPAPYSYFNRGQLYLIQQQSRETLAALRRLGVGTERLGRMDVFEVGCGSGHFLRELVSWGADPSKCAGADIRPDVIERGCEVNPNIRLFHADCTDTGEDAERYDLVVQNIVFSSVLQSDIREALAREMVRIARPGGVIWWCDLRYRNPRNHDVVGIGKKELLGLFADCRLELLRPILLVPPLARRLAPVSRTACDLLYLLPFLRGHYLATFRKP